MSYSFDDKIKYSPGLEALYRYEQNAVLTDAEIRIHHIYQDLKNGVMPWMTDYDNYSGKNKNMIGFFYPEDIENIRGIDRLKQLGIADKNKVIEQQNRMQSAMRRHG